LKLIDINLKKHNKIKDLPWVNPTKNVIKDVQQKQFINQLPNQLLLLSGFTNYDGVSCYANASLQMIFNCHYIINQLVQNEEHSALTKLAKSYLSQQNPLNSIPLKRFLGQHFNHVQQQDAAEFINALHCHSDSLKNCLKHELISILTCLNCYDVRTNKTPNYILPLAVIENKVTLNSLFNEFSKETILEINCSNCRITGNHSKVMNVSSTRQYLCIQLQLWNELQEKNRNKALKKARKVEHIPAYIINTCGGKPPKEDRDVVWKKVATQSIQPKCYSVTAKDGRIIIKPMNRETADVLKSLANTSLLIKEDSARWPRASIKGVQSDVKSEELQRCILSQNSHLGIEDETQDTVLRPIFKHGRRDMDTTN